MKFRKKKKKTKRDFDICCGGMTHDYVMIIGPRPLINLCKTLGIAHNERFQEELG